MKSPRSRNFVAYEDGRWWGGDGNTPRKETCPHCLNLGGTLSTCGITGLNDYNYPKSMIDTVLPMNIQATYSRGSEIDIVTVLTAHHKGHFEFKGCPITPGETPTQRCFDNHRLTFVQDNLYDAPKDDSHPHRAYIPDATFPDMQYDSSGVFGSLYSHRFKLPENLVGDTVILQWHYWTANSCVYEGYGNYKWPAGVSYGSAGTICQDNPDGNGVPEQFWNCAEVNITSSGSSSWSSSESRRNPTVSFTAFATVSMLLALMAL